MRTSLIFTWLGTSLIFTWLGTSLIFTCMGTVSIEVNFINRIKKCVTCLFY